MNTASDAVSNLRDGRSERHIIENKCIDGVSSGVKKVQVTTDLDICGFQDEASEKLIDKVDVNNLPYEVRERYLSAVRYYNDTIVDIEEKSKTEGIKNERERVIRFFYAKGQIDIIKSLYPDIKDEELRY